LILLAVSTAGCLELEGRPCRDGGDCISGFACEAETCVRVGEGEGEGEGEPIIDTRCPSVPRGEVVFDELLPAGQLSVVLSNGGVVVVYGGDEDRILSTTGGIEIDSFAGIVDVNGSGQDTVVVLAEGRAIAEFETSSGTICLDEPAGAISASTSSGLLEFYGTPSAASTILSLDTSSGDMSAHVGTDASVAVSMDTLGSVTTDPAFTCVGSEPTTCVVGIGLASVNMDSTSGDLELSPL
jgi:hypothetical protein